MYITNVVFKKIFLLLFTPTYFMHVNHYQPAKGIHDTKKKCYEVLPCTEGTFGSAPTPHTVLHPILNVHHVTAESTGFSILNTHFADLLGMCPGQTTSKNCKILKRKQLNQQIKYSDQPGTKSQEEEEEEEMKNSQPKVFEEFLEVQKIRNSLLLFTILQNNLYLKGSSCIVKSKRLRLCSTKMSHSSRKGKLLIQNLPENSDSIDIKQSGTSITRKSLSFCQGR